MNHSRRKVKEFKEQLQILEDREFNKGLKSLVVVMAADKTEELRIKAENRDVKILVIIRTDGGE